LAGMVVLPRSFRFGVGHAAVRAGDRLTQEAITELLAQRELAQNSHHCPHGRPTALRFSRRDLERHFKRV
jgi:DNA mismatch repair protein MutL